MDVRRVACVFVIIIILHCSLATGREEWWKRRERKTYSGYRRNTLEVDRNMVDRFNCKLELIHITEALGNLESKKPDLLEIISALPLGKKQALFDCLQKHYIPFQVFGEAGVLKSWYSKFSESISRHPAASPRERGVKLIQEVPAPSPGPVHAPASARVPSPAVSTPTHAPKLSPRSAPTSLPKHNPQPPSVTPKKSLPPSNHHLSDQSSGHKSSHDASHSTSKKSDEHNVLAIAIGSTAAGTFLLAALLFLCYIQCRKRKSPGAAGSVQKDDKPLLMLYLSDFAVDPSKKSGFRTSVSNKFRKLSFRSTPNQNGKASTLNGPLSIVSDAQNPSAATVPFGEKYSVESSAPPAPVPPPPPPPGPPPPPPPKTSRPPPPPKGSLLPPRPQPFNIKPKAPQPSSQGNTDSSDGEADGAKTKLKPFFWDKVAANNNRSMVWHHVNDGSFQFNEEMIENLFGCAPSEKHKADRKKEWSPQDCPSHIQLIDSKKAQNLSILLRALNLTVEEVCDALQEGNELPQELLQTMSKMAPTADEELKLRLYIGDISSLGPAERFLKALVEIPFAFKRMESLLFMSSFQEDISGMKESLITLEVASEELKSSRLFLKLLEAVLKTGNRMNDGTFRGGAQAFKLDTLLKLADVKGVDGKTTLLHFVVQEIIRSEGMRAARTAREGQSISSVRSEDLVDDSAHETEEYYRNLGLQVVSGLSNELKNVKKASVLDPDALRSTVFNLGQGLVNIKGFLNSEMESLEEDSGFRRTLKSFVESSEADVTWTLEEEKRVMALVKSTGDYFHGKAGKEEALHLFVIVRDFLAILDRVCNEIRQSWNKPASALKNTESPAASPSTNLHPPPSPDLRQRLFPAIVDRRVDDFSSDDDESSSP